MARPHRRGAGADRIWGGEGNDRLLGGAGRDVLAGGFGGDAFVFGAGDRVADFNASQADQIAFDARLGLDLADLKVSVGATVTTTTYAGGAMTPNGVTQPFDLGNAIDFDYVPSFDIGPIWAMLPLSANNTLIIFKFFQALSFLNFARNRTRHRALFWCRWMVHCVPQNRRQL